MGLRTTTRFVYSGSKRKKFGDARKSIVTARCDTCQAFNEDGEELEPNRAEVDADNHEDAMVELRKIGWRCQRGFRPPGVIFISVDEDGGKRVGQRTKGKSLTVRCVCPKCQAK